MWKILFSFPLTIKMIPNANYRASYLLPKKIKNKKLQHCEKGFFKKKMNKLTYLLKIIFIKKYF